MHNFIPHTIFENTFLLSSQRCIFWQEKKILILSDLHLGKSGHFRKSGIAVPQAVFKEDMQRFISLLQFFKPEQVIIVGDLFHSTDNKEHELFLKWRNDLKQYPILLVKGNHDILEENWYDKNEIVVVEDQLEIDQFIFTHDISKNIVAHESYIFSGHIHPCIRLTGKGKQALRFPCFYFAQQYAVLPAFGKFTGTYAIEPRKNESIFAIVENNILSINF
jgi:DNA ligase-associated metallophosphoesterase